MANSSFFKSSGTSSTTEDTIQGHITNAENQVTLATNQVALATAQVALASDHRDDASKYAITPSGNSFTLSSTNGSTSGLYSALHYATQAQNTANSIGTLDSLSDVTITSVANDEVISYDNVTGKFINQTPAEAGLLTANQSITLTGDATGSGTTSIAVTIQDDSHNHTIANIDDLQSTLDGKVSASSPTLTGTPIAPTASASTNTTQIATTAFVQTAITNLVDSSPSALNTLNELASAIGDDANFSTTINNSLATKAPLASPTLTGNPVAPTQSAGDNSTKIATTAFVTTATGASDPIPMAIALG